MTKRLSKVGSSKRARVEVSFGVPAAGNEVVHETPSKSETRAWFMRYYHIFNFKKGLRRWLCGCFVEMQVGAHSETADTALGLHDD